MSSNHKFFVLGILILIVVSIPFTIYLIKKQQETQSHAAAATVLSMVPANKTVNVGDEFTMDVNVDPGGVNDVSSMQLQIQYDPTVLQLESITPANPPFSQILNGFQTSTQSQNVAFATITFGIGSDVTTAVQTATTAATIKFKALAATSTPSTVSFVTGSSGQTKVLSLATTDNPGENVLSTANSASITIAGGTGASPTPGGAVSPTPTSLAPVCTSLNVDRNPSGTSPFSITFTANGYDSNGNIVKATFNFGDGPTQVVTNGNGLGTNTVSVPVSHTYNNPGTYPATITFTDNNNNLSQVTSACSQTIVVAAAPVQSGGSSGTGGSGSGTGSGSNSGSGNGAAAGTGSGAGTATATPTPTPTMKPGATTVVVGVIGGIAIMVVGGLLFAL